MRPHRRGTGREVGSQVAVCAFTPAPPWHVSSGFLREAAPLWSLNRREIKCYLAARGHLHSSSPAVTVHLSPRLTRDKLFGIKLRWFNLIHCLRNGPRVRLAVTTFELSHTETKEAESKSPKAMALPPKTLSKKTARLVCQCTRHSERYSPTHSFIYEGCENAPRL